MKNLRKQGRTLIATGVATLAFGATSVLADSTIENLAETFYSDPNEYSFTSEADSEFLQFETSRRLQVCLTEQEDIVPLVMEHDNTQTTVNPGECEQIRTQEVTVRPARDIPDGMVMMWNYSEEDTNRQTGMGASGDEGTRGTGVGTGSQHDGMQSGEQDPMGTSSDMQHDDM